jgi:hypothetical protein
VSCDALSDPRGTGASASFCNTWASDYVGEVSGMVSYVSHVTGMTGRPVPLNANYFRLPTATNWQLYQYRVSFVPNEEGKSAKHKMVCDHKEELGGYLFDGTMLYTSVAYDEDVSQIFFLFIICVILKLIS